jgi:hypothetical protein
MKKNYILWYRLDQNDRYLIWISDKIDSVFVEKKAIATFESVAELRAFASRKGIALVDEAPILNNFDTVQAWIPDPNQELNCIDCMNAWNLVKDITTAFRLKFKGNVVENLTLEVYDKICQNNTIPAHIPGAEGGKTNLKDKERKLLAEIMTHAISIARKML